MVEENVEFIFIYKMDKLILHNQNRQLCQILFLKLRYKMQLDAKIPTTKVLRLEESSSQYKLPSTRWHKAFYACLSQTALEKLTYLSKGKVKSFSAAALHTCSCISKLQSFHGIVKAALQITGSLLSLTSNAMRHSGAWQGIKRLVRIVAIWQTIQEHLV